MSSKRMSAPGERGRWSRPYGWTPRLAPIERGASRGQPDPQLPLRDPRGGNTHRLLTIGLDPTLGIVHADYLSRNSLALDLMEPIRPAVDVIDLLQQRTFRASDFYETRRGNCRLCGRIAKLFGETAASWAAFVGWLAALRTLGMIRPAGTAAPVWRPLLA
jgi:hypothetical protein